MDIELEEIHEKMCFLNDKTLEEMKLLELSAMNCTVPMALQSHLELYDIQEPLVILPDISEQSEQSEDDQIENKKLQEVLIVRLLTLIVENDLYEVKAMIKHKIVPANANNDLPLKVAVFHNRIDIVKFLINQKDVNLTVDLHFPITTAASKGFLRIVQILVNRGVTPAGYNNEPLYEACKNGHDKVVEYLLQFSSVNPDIKSLMIAARNGHLLVIKLLEKHVDVKYKNNKAARVALKHGQMDVVRYLLNISQ